jgi:DNA-directed RNA polymerase specialized sigma24 family protein
MSELGWARLPRFLEGPTDGPASADEFVQYAYSFLHPRRHGILQHVPADRREDVVQDLILELYRGAARYLASLRGLIERRCTEAEEPSGSPCWQQVLQRWLVNRAHWRGTDAGRGPTWEELDEDQAHVPAHEDVAAGEARRLIRECIEELSDHGLRLVFIGRLLHELPWSDVAAFAGMKTSTEASNAYYFRRDTVLIPCLQRHGVHGVSDVFESPRAQ